MTAEQCRAARGWLGWTQGELASAAKVGISTVKDFENGLRKTLSAIVGQIQLTFEISGVQFIDGNENEPPGITVKETGYFEFFEDIEPYQHSNLKKQRKRRK